MDIQKILSELSIEEKAALVAGTEFMYTNSVPRLKIPSLRMSDGPHGLRVQNNGGDNGVTGSEKATAFPTAVSTASSWNPSNTYKMGEAIAKECLYYGVDVLLGPAVNIKRNPLCGRNFEYFSEDPLLAGKMAAAEVNGVQNKGVGVSVKHFALNNSENYRFMSDSVCDDRAMREIYLKVFEIIVKESKPHTVMCAYNKINGTFCSENNWLLNKVLREEWGFDGLVMSDWGAVHDRVAGVKAGLDLEMPGDTDICRKQIIDAATSGDLTLKELNKAVENVLLLVQRYENNLKCGDVDFEEHNVLAAEIAEDSAVLLKNQGVLPLDKTSSFCVAGDLFYKTRYQGAGSSMIKPTLLTTPQDAFDKRKVNYTFVRGYDENAVEPDDVLIAKAVKTAEKFDTVLVFAGLTDRVESEGADRESMRLPPNQLKLIDELLKTNKKIIVILYGGSPVELPFANNVDAILNMYLPGQNGGTAVANLLFGDKSPSGKLAETWQLSFEDVPFSQSYSKTVNEIYKESVFVGYRYYLTANKPVRYPFGYGLSYTDFEYDNMRLQQEGGNFKISCDIKNIGTYDGAEIVELYVKPPLGVYKPVKKLAGFFKVYLKAGESKKVEITVCVDELKYWNIKENRFVLEGGEYVFELCKSAENTQLCKKVILDGENALSPYSKCVEEVYSSADLDKVTDNLFEEMSHLTIPKVPPKLPLTTESRFTDLRQTFMGRILFDAVLSVAKKDLKKALKLPQGTERDNKIKGAMFLKRILESNSLRSMSMTARKSMPFNFAEGFVHLANGHLIKGIKSFGKKIKVPKLPKDKETD